VSEKWHRPVLAWLCGVRRDRLRVDNKVPLRFRPAMAIRISAYDDLDAAFAVEFELPRKTDAT
jgi:hypothetical protein